MSFAGSAFQSPQAAIGMRFASTTRRPANPVWWRLPSHVAFRANWVDGDEAFIVNRSDPLTHIVLFDRFWSQNPTIP